MPPVRSLSFHAGYRCQHAGACCSSNWPIPVEAGRLLTLRRALADRTLTPAGCAAADAIETHVGADADDMPALLARAHGRCVFHGASGRCRIHATLGHEALPLACRQFPRVTVEDPRGVSVTLSHFCPTAAGLLDRSTAPFTIVLDPPAFPASGEYVGLDARGALPPLLRRDMLMDWDSWWEFERLAVVACAEGPDAGTALARLRGAVAFLETWSPADGPLVDRVRDALRSAAPLPARVPWASLVAEVMHAIPAEIRPDPPPLSPVPADGVMRRLLAAHAFGSWHIHQGTGIRTWLLGVEAAAALVAGGCSIREADLRLRHLADPHALGHRLAML